MAGHLCILLKDPLAFVRLSECPAETIRVAGNVYQKRSVADDDAVFYDWIMDEADTVRALEVHLAPDDALLQSARPLTAISSVEIAPFPRIWFGQDRLGEPRGKEAFGDIFFYGTARNDLAIVVGLDWWLSPSESRRLLNHLELARS